MMASEGVNTIEISDPTRLHPSPLVSVYMITYMHRPFIEQAVAGVVSQQCSFGIELIIGEDCSPDGTLDLLRSLQEKYPDLIRILTGTQNVGGRANAKRCVAAARGRYVAICEGDDFWTDPMKLANQVRLMQRMPEISLVCHAVNLMDQAHPEAHSKVYRSARRSRLLSQSELILGDGALVPTCSILVRSEAMRQRPEWWEQCPVGDYPLVLRASMLGHVAYMNNVMATHRINVPGSWTIRHHPSIDNRTHHAEQIHRMLAGFAQQAGTLVSNDVSIVTSKYYFDAIVRTAGTLADRRRAFDRYRPHIRLADRLVASLSLALGLNLGWIRTPFKGASELWRSLLGDVVQPRLKAIDRVA